MLLAAFRKRASIRHRFVACLLALAFLAVEAAALAHEFSHDLHLHDDASCVLHFYAEHLAKTTVANAVIVSLVETHDVHTAHDADFVAIRPALGYRVRAPPHSSRSV